MAVDNAAPDPVVPPDVSGTPQGLPTNASSDVGNPAQPQPQPQRPAPERFSQGVGRGLAGPKFVVDGKGNVVSARTTADSPIGEFGNILGGIVFGALAGASKARVGRTPSHETGGGFGAGAGAAVESSRPARRSQQNASSNAIREPGASAKDVPRAGGICRPNSTPSRPNG